MNGFAVCLLFSSLVLNIIL